MTGGEVRALLRSDVRVLVRTQARQGWARVLGAWFPILQAAVAGGIAYAIAYWVVGHPMPFFAPVSAWVALGFSMDRSVRRVAELAVGVAIGVGLGDLVVHVIGSGAWQMVVVLFFAALIARFLDRGAVLTTQAGIQAIVIVGLPAASGGPFGRWVDAAVGGAVALAVTLLTPSDPRRRPRALGRSAVDQLAVVLHLLARGLATTNAVDVEDALVRARATQPVLDDWTEAATNAHELSRISPASRRYRDELGRAVHASVLVDRAIRNARVLVRRSVSVVEAEQPHDLAAVAAQVELTARAAGELATAIGAGRDPERARDRLLAVTGDLDPFVLAPGDWQAQSLVLLHRSLAVDLLETAGVSPGDARDRLPEI